MTKWEYLVLSPHQKGTVIGVDTVIGYKLNDKIILFEVSEDRNLPDRDGVNYGKYNSNGQNQILNELGDEGWELIKIRGNGITPTYYFKRPL